MDGASAAETPVGSANVPRHYATLELLPSASAEEIKRQYRTLARKYHPDLAGEAGLARMKSINEAYHVLSDPRRRAAYDEFGDRGVEAAESPYTGPIVDQLGMSLVMTVATFFAVCIMACIIMLLATVSVKIDGVVNWTWTATLFPVWIVLTSVLLLLILYLVVLARNAIADRENSKVTWRNFLGIVPVTMIAASLIMIAVKLDLDPPDLYWLIVIAPLFLVNLAGLFQMITHLRPAQIKEALLQQGIVDVSMPDIFGIMISNTMHVLWPIAFEVLIGLRRDRLLDVTAWIVAIPIFVVIGVALVQGLMWLRVLVRNEKITVGQALTSYFGQLVQYGLPLTSILLVIMKIEGTGGNRSMAVCLIPLFLQCSFYFVIAFFGACFFGNSARQELSDPGSSMGGVGSGTVPESQEEETAYAQAPADQA